MKRQIADALDGWAPLPSDWQRALREAGVQTTVLRTLSLWGAEQSGDIVEGIITYTIDREGSTVLAAWDEDDGGRGYVSLDTLALQKTRVDRTGTVLEHAEINAEALPDCLQDNIWTH